MATENPNDEITRLLLRGEKDPRTHTFARLADLYRKSGDLDRALEVIEGGLKHHRHYLNARLVHARVLRELGQATAARAAFDRVLQIDSENLVAQAALSEMGRLAVAPTNPSEPAVTRPDGPAATRWLARLDADWQRVRAGNGAGTGSEGGADAEPGSDVQAPEAGAEATDATESVSLGPSIDDPGVAQLPAESTKTEPPSSTGATVPTEASEPGQQSEPEVAHPAEPAELETATLAALYLRQGLAERAIGVYERLLARDPYNARLAAALEDARQRPKDPVGSTPPDPLGHASLPGPTLPKRDGERLRSVSDGVPSPTPVIPVPPPTRPNRRAVDEPVRSAETASRSSIRDQLGQILGGVPEGDGADAAGSWSEWLERLHERRD